MQTNYLDILDFIYETFNAEVTKENKDFIFHIESKDKQLIDETRMDNKALDIFQTNLETMLKAIEKARIDRA